MPDTLLTVIAIELLAILVVLIGIAWGGWSMLGRLEKYVRLVFGKKFGWHHGFQEGYGGPFSIWSSSNGQWKLMSPCGQPGCDCGPPPSQPGSYNEQVIRKECPVR